MLIEEYESVKNLVELFDSIIRKEKGLFFPDVIRLLLVHSAKSFLRDFSRFWVKLICLNGILIDYFNMIDQTWSH